MAAQRRGLTLLAARGGLRAAAPRLALVALAAAALTACASARDPSSEASLAALAKPEGAVRVATFNIGLSGAEPGEMAGRLRAGGEPRAAALAEILQRVRPDIVLLNEIDHDPGGGALALFEAELASGRNGAAPLAYAHRFTAPVNTGVYSGLDLDQDGQRGPGDAWGWGSFPGQYGMAILSRFPLETETARTFQRLLWRDFAASEGGANIPADPHSGAPYYTEAAWARLRLSSKSHWDVVALLPSGRRLHLLASHPTPPVFDGPEDRNGLRNRAEILFWRAYIDGEDWIADDRGGAGGLPEGASFVILGDLNNDPADGDSRRDAVAGLLAHPRVRDPWPRSAGAAAASAAGGRAVLRRGARWLLRPEAAASAAHAGDPALDTADWGETGRTPPGNLRVDYALPSSDLPPRGAGVFWPPIDHELGWLVGEWLTVDAAALKEGDIPESRRTSSDHRLVWVDLGE